MNRSRRVLALGTAGVLLLGGGLGYARIGQQPDHDAALTATQRSLGVSDPDARAGAAAVAERAATRATCGRGSAPETGLQGEVPAKDEATGRATKPYTCNLVQVNKPLGEGAGLQAAYYKDCAYYGSPGSGVRVVDVRDRRNPKITTHLTSPAMIDPWESLKVHAGRGLLAAVEGTVSGPLFFDVYDVSKDCAKPVLKASMPVNTLGHEGNWSQDGSIFYATSAAPALLTAIDVRDPTNPKLISITPLPVVTGHGLSTNKAGTRLYTVDSGAGGRAGLLIFDVSDIHAFKTGLPAREISSLRWADGNFTQHTIPVSYRKHPYLVVVDEHGYGGARIIDIADDTKPRIVTKIRTEIQLAQNTARREETQAGPSGFGYNMHYCNVDRLDDPTILACSSRASGVRVFDIRSLLKPREIAYWNHAGEMSAQVHLDAQRGELWTTDYTWGLVVAKFTNGAWPFRSAKQ